MFVNHFPLLPRFSKKESVPRGPSNWLSSLSINGLEAIGPIKHPELAIGDEAAVLIQPTLNPRMCA